jgi:hypothetical protein
MATNNPTSTVAAVLRELGLRQRERGGVARDFRVEGRFEGGACVETYVVPETPGGREAIEKNAALITERTTAEGFPFTLTAGTDGQPWLTCGVVIERKTMKARTTPKRYETASVGAPGAEDVPEGKVPRSLNIEGATWAKAKNRAAAVDRLSISRVGEQLIEAYVDGALTFYAEGVLVPPAPTPTSDQVREVLRRSARQFCAGTDSDTDTTALADALTAALERAGFARPVAPLDRIELDLAAIQQHAATTLAPGLGWSTVPTATLPPERAKATPDALQEAAHAVGKLRDGYTVTDAIAPKDADAIRDSLTEAAAFLDSARRDAPAGVPAAAAEIAERIRRAAELVAKAARRRTRAAA